MLQIILLCDYLIYPRSSKAYDKFHLRNYYDYSLHEHISLGSITTTHCLNHMRYHGVSIENMTELLCCAKIFSIFT